MKTPKSTTGKPKKADLRRTVCPICGKEFEKQKPNAKYCSDPCRQKGRYEHRKAWEERTGYKEKQRVKMQLARNRRALDKKARQGTTESAAVSTAPPVAAKSSQEPQETASRQRRKRMPTTGGNMTPEYWEAYRARQLEANGEALIFVNGISLDDPYFGLSVCTSIEELGQVYIERVK